MHTDEKPGIIVLGAPRSGTTLLRRLLDAHPGIACPGETFLLRSCARFLRSEVIANDLDYGVAGGLASLGLDIGPVHAQLRGIVEQVHAHNARAAGKPRWAEKTAVDAFYIDEIEALYAEHAQFVCIVRHGLDVVASMHELTDSCERFLEELRTYLAFTPYPAEAYAHAWRSVTERMLRFADDHPETVALVRYEDLVDDPETVMAELFHFLNEPWHAQVVADALSSPGRPGLGDWKTYGEKSVHNKSVARWRALSQSTLNRTAQILNPTLESCGYDPVEVAAPRGHDEAVRWFALTMMEKHRSV